MQFKPEEGRWVCPIDDCKVISYPEIDGDRTRLLLGRGGLQLVCVNGQFYLRAIDNNVALVLPITAVGGSGTDDFVEVRFRVPLVSLDVP